MNQEPLSIDGQIVECDVDVTAGQERNVVRRVLKYPSDVLFAEKLTFVFTLNIIIFGSKVTREIDQWILQNATDELCKKTDTAELPLFRSPFGVRGLVWGAQNPDARSAAQQCEKKREGEKPDRHQTVVESAKKIKKKENERRTVQQWKKNPASLFLPGNMPILAVRLTNP